MKRRRETQSQEDGTMKTRRIRYLPEMVARSGDNCSDVTGMSGVNDQITDIVNRQPTSVCMYSSLLVQYNNVLYSMHSS